MAEKSKSIVVKTPKGMTKLEWESIRGSNLHAQMIKNRSIMIIDNEPASKKMLKIVQEWLEANSGTQYYFEERRDLTTNWKNTISVYLEGDTDAVAYCLQFKDHDYPEEDPPPAKIPLPPLKPFPMGGPINALPAPSMQKELMDLIMQELIVQEKTRYYDVMKQEKDRWSASPKTDNRTAYDSLYKTVFDSTMDYHESPKKSQYPKGDNGK